MKISTGEVMRYLKMGSVAADERVSVLIEELSGIFTANIFPKSVYGIWDCRLSSTALILDGMTIESKSLAKHLAGCRHVVLLAATLGTEADTLLRRYSVQDMGKAVIAQAVCAAMIEAYCEEAVGEIRQRLPVSSLRPTTRFSPGYGDFNIAYQKDIVRFLNCDRRIGLSLTDGYMLIPSKSVTAIIGFTEEKIHYEGKCRQCEEKFCEFREPV